MANDKAVTVKDRITLEDANAMRKLALEAAAPAPKTVRLTVAQVLDVVDEGVQHMIALGYSLQQISDHYLAHGYRLSVRALRSRYAVKPKAGAKRRTTKRSAEAAQQPQPEAAPEQPRSGEKSVLQQGREQLERSVSSAEPLPETMTDNINIAYEEQV